MEKAIEYDTVQTPGPTSLTLIADILDVPVAELAEINPSSLRGMVPEAYPLHIPKGSADSLVAAFQRIPSNHLDAWRMHRVTSGETLAAIGKRYNVQPSNIVAVNHLEAEQPQDGDRLLIPSAPRAEAPARRAAATSTARRRPAAATASSTRRRPVTTSSARPSAHKPAAIIARSTN